MGQYEPTESWVQSRQMSKLSGHVPLIYQQHDDPVAISLCYRSIIAVSKTLITSINICPTGERIDALFRLGRQLSGKDAKTEGIEPSLDSWADRTGVLETSS
jgi:hypothetical protein